MKKIEEIRAIVNSMTSEERSAILNAEHESFNVNRNIASKGERRMKELLKEKNLTLSEWKMWWNNPQ